MPFKQCRVRVKQTHQCPSHSAGLGLGLNRLTDALDTVHGYVQLLSWAQLCQKDVTKHRTNAGLRKHISLVPDGHPLHVLGVDLR